MGGSGKKISEAFRLNSERVGSPESVVKSPIRFGNSPINPDFVLVFPIILMLAIIYTIRGNQRKYRWNFVLFIKKTFNVTVSRSW